MKFICESCKTKYSIADEKVRRKILKIRCKNCQNVITVREPTEADPAFAPAPARSQSRPLEAALDGALGGFGSSPAIPMGGALGGYGDGDYGDGDQQTQIAQMPTAPPAAPQPPPPEEDEWHFSLAGKQDGPMTLAQVAARVAKYKPTDEVYVWRDGFDDWLPGHLCPELKPLLRKLLPPPPAPPPVRRTVPPMPSPAMAPAPAPARVQAPAPAPAQTYAPAARSESRQMAMAQPRSEPRLSSPARAPAPVLAAAPLPAPKQAPAQAPVQAPHPAPMPVRPAPVFAFSAPVTPTAPEAPRLAPQPVGPSGPPMGAVGMISVAPTLAGGVQAVAAAGPGPEDADAAEPFGAILAQKARYDEAAAEPAPGFSADPNVPLPEGFVIEEASRVVRLPLPPPISGPGPMGQSGQMGGLAARPAGAASVSQAFFAQSAPPGMMMSPSAVLPVSPVLAPLPRRKAGAGRYVAYAGGAVVLAVAIVLVVVLGGPKKGPVAASGGGNDPVGTDDNSLGFNVGGTTTIGAITSNTANTPGTTEHPTVAPPRPHPTIPGIGGGTAPPVTPSGTHVVGSVTPTPLPGALNRLGDGASDSTSAAPPSNLTQVQQQVTDDSLRQVVQNGTSTLQLCYQRALSRNPSLGHLKVDVDISIASSGTVINVGLPADTDTNLGTCMNRLIKNWSFPQNSKDYDFSFPVVFKSE